MKPNSRDAIALFWQPDKIWSVSLIFSIVNLFVLWLISYLFNLLSRTNRRILCRASAVLFALGWRGLSLLYSLRQIGRMKQTLANPPHVLSARIYPVVV